MIRAVVTVNRNKLFFEEEENSQSSVYRKRENTQNTRAAG